jgi:hypothetical protein
MSFALANRVQETTSTSGTGTITLNGAIAGFQNFNAGIGIGNTTSYVIFDPTANVWEAGIGTLATSNTFARTTVLSNSSGTTTQISLAGNTANVWCDYLTEKAVTQYDVGTGPNQIPLNQYLGTMAWQDAKAVQIGGGSIANPVITRQYNIQPTITSLSATATLTIAQLLNTIVQVTSASAVALTLPTGTLTDAGVLNGVSVVNNSFLWIVINTGSVLGAITMTAGTGHTYVGNATVAINTSAQFQTVKTATNTFVTYRIA